MKSIKICLLTLFAIISLIGCDSFNQTHLIGKYYLIEPNFKENSKTLSYGLGSGNFNDVVSQTVSSVGYNEDYIIVKQHPRGYKKPLDKSVTNYFIIDMKDSSSYHGKIYGPFNEQEFLRSKKELAISDRLIFSIVFENLE